MAKTRMVVIGAAGFIGRATVNRLVELGYDVLAVDLASTGLEDPNRKFKTAFADITDESYDCMLQYIIRRYDRVLHLAAVANMADADKDPARAWKVNVEGTLRVIENCDDAHAERLVFSSTGSVISPTEVPPFKEDALVAPTNFYGWTKAVDEQLIQKLSKTPWTILRYGYVYGPTKLTGAIGGFYSQLKQGKQPTIFGGRQMNDFVYIDDIVEANVKALTRPVPDVSFELFHVGSGQMRSILEIYRYVQEALGSPIEPNVQPARGADVWPQFLFDLTKSHNWLGYEPAWTPEAGISKMVEILEGQ